MLNKQITIPMETSAYYQAQTDLNVRFWSQDLNTAELRFLITRNNFPLPLSMENVSIILALESGESFIVTEDVDIVNQVEGVASYIIPQEFMAVATDVVGQIYVGTKDGNEVVVQRKFSFKVENDLLSSIPSEETIRYIKMFDDLRAEMNERLGGVENAITQLEQNILDVNNARDTGITAINNLYNAKLVTFNDDYTAKMNALNASFDTMETYVTDSQADMVAKKTAFDEAVAGSGLVTEASATSWQKYKLTDDSGVLPIIAMGGDLAILQALPTGFYYASGVAISGMGQTSAAGFVTVWESNGGLVKNISFKPYNSTQEFIMIYYNEWSGWTNKFDGLEKSVDAQNKANVAENNAKNYADTKIASKHAVLFSGSVSGVGEVITLTESMNNYTMLVITGSYPGGNFSEIVVPAGMSSSTISIQQVNIANGDGANPYAYELNMSITSSTKLTFTVDVNNDINSDTASGANANRFVVSRIDGLF